MSKKPTAPSRGDTPTIAEYTGAISRWCDLTGNVPLISADQPKAKSEFEAFNNHLDQTAADLRKFDEVKF